MKTIITDRVKVVKMAYNNYYRITININFKVWYKYIIDSEPDQRSFSHCQL